MSVIGSIKSWFQSVGRAKDKQIHQAHNGDKPPEKSGGVGDTKTTVQDAKESQQDWHGDT